MKTILDVYVFDYSTEEAKPLYSFIDNFVHNLFNESTIPWEKTGVVAKLTKAVLKLSNSKINHILLHVLDQYFNLSEDTLIKRKSEKFLAQSCFTKFRSFIVTEEMQEKSRLAKALGFNFYETYADFYDAELNIKKDRRQKLQKLFG